jgi:hypothetical protein
VQEAVDHLYKLQQAGYFSNQKWQSQEPSGKCRDPIEAEGFT